MSKSVEDVTSFLCEELAVITDGSTNDFTGDTALIGSEARINSRELVELLLAAEEFADEEMGVEFDWTSDSAMSEARSFLRTVSTLAAHVCALQAGG